MIWQKVAPALFITAIIGGLVLADSATCAPRREVKLFSPSGKGALHLTVRTEEGLGRYVFTPNYSFAPKNGESHFAGVARYHSPQGAAGLAALSSFKDGGWIFFSSRRTGRPVAISFSHATSHTSPRIRLYRVPSTTIPCGVSALHEASAATPVVNTSRRLKVLTISPFSDGIRPYSPQKVLEVATDADYEFFLRHGSESSSFIRAVLNATDALYSSSFGIRIKVTSQRVSSSGNSNQSTISASALLEEFRKSPFASSSPADVRHLFTGKRIEGLTIGIAYIGGVCAAGGRYGVGLSASVSAALHPFLAAHEIAHNLGAVHDDVRNSVMNPAITPSNNRFSERTKSDVREFISSSGSCLSTEPLSEVNLRLSPRSAGTFSARTTFSASSTQVCRVTLEGSADGELFTPVAVRSIRTNPRPRSTTSALSGPLPPLSPPQLFYFRSRVACGRQRKVSGINSERYGMNQSGGMATGLAEDWLAALKESLR